MKEVNYDRFFPSPDSSLWTSLRYFSLSRVFIALVMCLLLPVSIPNFEIAQPVPFQTTALVYFGLALLMGLLARRAWPGFYPQLLVQIISDIFLLGLLMHFAGEQRNGLSLLLLVPVAAAAVLSSRKLSLFFAALASLVVLVDALVKAADGRGEFGFMQAGLLGACLFAIAWVINSLAQRLNAQEEAARQAALELRNQQAVNQMVIAELTYGVVVLDPANRPRFMNRAAAELLGKPVERGASSELSQDAWNTVLQTYLRWQQQGPVRADSVEVILSQTSAEPNAVALRHRVRLRFLAAPEAGDTVILMEDTDHLEERAQQLKLASMGRLSASIAHEIRNPLGAIRHANSLLQETLARTVDNSIMTRRFTDIVEKNALRIDRIVEDVLGLARRERSAAEPIDFALFMDEFLPDFFSSSEQLNTSAQRARVRVQCNSQLLFHFDANHLRQVLVNLLSNACRYGSDLPGAVSVSLSERGSAPEVKLELRVSDDGPGLSPEVAAHIFEPFHTTEARGTGLGLFLAQELCAINQASIRYESPPLARETGFVIRPRVVAGMPQSGRKANSSEPDGASNDPTRPRASVN